MKPTTFKGLNSTGLVLIVIFSDGESIQIIFEILGKDIRKIKVILLHNNMEVYSYGKYNYCTGLKLEDKNKSPILYYIKIK